MILRVSSWTSVEVARAVCGALHARSDEAIAAVSTDTRDALKGTLFVALQGPRFDGHDFVQTAVDAGASALLVAGARRAAWASIAERGACAVVEVEDTLQALGDLARAWRRAHPARVIGLTGSNGKTSTKDILTSILGAGHSVLATEGNLNNLVGLPMTLLGLTRAHRVAVVEMGMNAPGEIRRLTQIADPDVGLLLNVGPAHIGELGSLAAIAAAKGELYEELRSTALRVANRDDPHVRALAETWPGRTRWFSAKEDADVRLLETEDDGDGQILRLSVDQRRLEARLGYAGPHQAMNAAAAVAAATAMPEHLSLSLEQIRAGLQAARPAGGRFTVHRVADRILIDDGYNANPASVEAAITTAAARAARESRRLVVVLGEMRELGSFSASAHAAIGHLVAKEGAALFGTLGAGAAEASSTAAGLGIRTHHEDEDVTELARWLTDHLGARDLILLKGSRGIRTERLIPLLSGEG